MWDNYSRYMIVEKIVDGDTMHINCDLWFDIQKKWRSVLLV